MSSIATAQTGRGNRTMIFIAAIAALALSMAFAVRPTTTLAFTPGDNGHPNGGPSSNLMGGSADFTFQGNATLTCTENTAGEFTFHLDYDVTGTLPAGATLVVYLSPNQGAINNNAGGNAAAYIAAVESNFTVIDVAGLTGSGTLDFTVPVTTPFQLSGGGVLGVIASEAGANGQSWSSKTNSLNCSEAAPTPTPTPTPTASPTPTPTPSETPTASPTPTPEQSVQEGTPTPSPTPEGSVQGGTGTPAPSQPDTAMGVQDGPSPIPTLAFGLILLAALGTLAWVNVKSARNRA